ncbi:TAXI family TRAP transporter solute-binding subunit [Leptothoe spongobia]|uniref:TAXI family TRAP transporter solute-binding subunit n=1 Tax=Leptothoe spongobia TAU-MAC 1115 TaxID=1967444 RepID=A0A947DH38_9CYAN|nr:TAXI family TRAP transporter solute-binding subunit [Leptothoe spongobia]MBT9316756.1 TAXI family TRAP transporter solute-binding subunit [Leptothoe spongobia TAU-MAC 1115]
MGKWGRWGLGFVVLASIGIAIASITKLIYDQNRIYTIRLATGGPTGEYYAFGQAIAQVTETNEPKIRVEVMESAGSNQNMDDINTHTADFALVQNDTPVLNNVRAVAQLYPEMFHLIAANDANIRTLTDLKGKRIALMPEGSGSYNLFWPLTEHYGLTKYDFQFNSMSPTDAYDALQAGNVDAVFRIIGLGNSSISKLLANNRFQLVPIDQIGALQLTQPYLKSTVIPKGSYDGGSPIPSKDLPVVAVSSLLIANVNVNPDVVKAITRILYEHRNELVSINPRTANIQSPEASQNLGFPLHEGAHAYYTQDNPSFLVTYAEPIGLLLSISILLCSSLWQGRQWLISNQKDRADRYNLEILDLIEKIEQAQDFDELQNLRQQLLEILRKVVVDLDIDRISPESFQSFTFPWEVANTAIRHQEIILSGRSKPVPQPNSSNLV